MKKSLILIILLQIGFKAFSQQTYEFKTGVNLIENTVVSEIKSQNSVLFVFKGDSHLITFYLDLAKKLKKQFKKSKLKIKFNFNLHSDNPLKADLKLIPNRKFNETDFEIICSIKTNFIKALDNNLIKKRMQNYTLNLEMEKSETNSIIESAVINVITNNTILTQNTNSSKLIYKLIIE